MDATQANRLKISTYSTANIVPVLVAEYRNQSGPSGPLPVQTHYVNLPRGASLVRAEFSPQQQSIFYDRHIDYATTHTENLWISKADGQDFHELGQVVVQKGKEDSGVADMEWLPGGKQISFLYRHKLYVLPVATPK